MFSSSLFRSNRVLPSSAANWRSTQNVSRIFIRTLLSRFKNIFSTHNGSSLFDLSKKSLYANKILILHKLIKYVYRKFYGTLCTFRFIVSVHVHELVENMKETSNVNRIKIDSTWFRMTRRRDSRKLLLCERTLRFALPHSDTDSRAKDLRREQATAVTVYSFSLRNDPRNSQVRQVRIESRWDAQSQNRQVFIDSISNSNWVDWFIQENRYNCFYRACRVKKYS